MPDTLTELRRDLATAYRIVANEGMLDAFGHISVRNPDNPQRYFLSRSRAPALVQAEDILEYDLNSNPIVPPTTQPYLERVIHGEIFKARPDVNAVCHHHAPSIMPFAISGVPLLPVFHLGAAMGRRARPSGIAATSSATLICLSRSPRRAHRSRVRSGHTPSC